MGRGDQTLLTCPSLVPSAVNGESAWERWLVCGCAVPYITNFNALCCLRPFYQNQHECSAVWAAAAPHVHLWVLAAHDPVAASPLFFYRSWWLQTRNTPPQLRFWRCSIDPLPLGSGQNHPNPYAQLRRSNVQHVNKEKMITFKIEGISNDVGVCLVGMVCRYVDG